MKISWWLAAKILIVVGLIASFMIYRAYADMRDSRQEADRAMQRLIEHDKAVDAAKKQAAEWGAEWDARLKKSEDDLAAARAATRSQ
jgi:hypothetical protein